MLWRLVPGNDDFIDKTGSQYLLDDQYRLQVGRQQFYQANSNAALEIEDMLGELHGEEFQSSIQTSVGALSSLATHADDIVYKDQLVMMASQFIERAKVLQDELNTYQTSLNTEVKNRWIRLMIWLEKSKS